VRLDLPWMREPATRRVIGALTAAGAPVRFVGGCVRDALLDRIGPGTDVDIATPLPPEAVVEALKAARLRAIPTGMAHGTVTALDPASGRTFEITTLRLDVATDGRHATVAFTDDWRADAARRDFTMNALSADPDGTVHDYFGGVQDALAGRVRFVGDPARRLEEDYLRLLRFFRFHAHYGRGAPDAQALAACRSHAAGLERISGERLRGETLQLRTAADYLPIGNRNLAFGILIPPPGYNLDQREEIGRRVEDTMRPFWEAGALEDDDPQAYARAVAGLPEVPTFDPATMSPGPPVRPPSVENYFFVARESILFHGAISDDARRVRDVVTLMNHATGGQAAPGVIAFAFQVPLFQLGGNTGSAIKLQLSGADLEQVKGVAAQLFGMISGRYGIQSVQPDPANFSLRTPEVQVQPDLVRLSELGLGVRDVALAVQVVGDGAIVDEFSIEGEAIDLKVIAAESVAASGADGMTDLASLPIATPTGRVVTLGSVATVLPVEAPQEIARVGRQRSVTLQVTPPPGVPLEQVMGDLEGMVAGLRDSGAMPPAVRSEIAGSAGKLREVQRALLGDGTLAGTIGSSLVLALVVVYLLMCVLFQDFVRPLVIMFSVPLATLGGFLGLAAVHWWSQQDPYAPVQNLDVLTMLGFVLLIGVVVNNAILIVHQAGNFLAGRADVEPADLRAWGSRMTPRIAIALSVRSRVRPIFMGTLTSVGGMLPLVLMPGAGSELYRGLGSVVVGGLVLSTVFTLLLVPLLLGFVLRGGAESAPIADPSPTPAPAPSPASPPPGGGTGDRDRGAATPPAPVPTPARGVAAPGTARR